VQTDKTNAQREYRRRRAGALFTHFDDEIGDLVAIASIREQARLFGVDRVRGL
jgi:hypothetical protein